MTFKSIRKILTEIEPVLLNAQVHLFPVNAMSALSISTYYLALQVVSN